MIIAIIAGTWAYGFGPVATCLGVAEEARECGHEIVVISSHRAVSMIREEGFRVIEAPAPLGPSYPEGPVHRLADAAGALGFGDESFVRETMNLEIDIYRSLAIDIVFHDYQLTAPVAAAYCQIPV